MNLKEFANVDAFYRDIDTGKILSWREYMWRIIEKLGIEKVKPYIPYGVDHLKEKIKEDINFNNTKLVTWLAAAGFRSEINKRTQSETIIPLHCGLSTLFVQNGITCFSPADGVSVLKEAARMLCGVKLYNE